MMKRRRYRLVISMVGIFLVLISPVAATTSHFTPWLSQYPAVLNNLGAAGFYILAVFTLLSLYVFMSTRYMVFGVLSIIGLLLTLFTQLTLLGSAFQLLLAGWLIGLSLILLGSKGGRFTRKILI